MGVFEMVVLIVIVGCLTGLAKTYLANRQANSAELEDAMSRIDNLEERIRVLESVVTDDQYRLKHEIDKLAD